MVTDSAASTKAGGPSGIRALGRPHRYEVSVLNGFELRRDGVTIPISPSCQRLVALLALRERPILRSYAAGTLWPDATETRAAASLRTALWRLRDPPVRLVLASGTHVWLAPNLSVDITEAIRTARQFLNPVIPSSEWDSQALSLAGDESRLAADVLPDWYEDWVIVAREQFRQMRLHALEELSHRLIDVGRYARAVGVAMAAVAGEPLRESAQHALIRAHLADGNRSEALRQYASFRNMLLTELGIEPSPELTALVTASM